MVVGLLLLSRLDATTSFWLLSLDLVVFGVGLGLCMQILTIMPHMHLLGKEMKVTATLPDGAEKELVWIKDWDYRWQDSFRYKEPLLLPKGTKLKTVSHYDNSTANKFNPNPNINVRYGAQSWDEMNVSFVGIVVDPKADPTKVFRSHGPRGPQVE